MRHEVNKGIVCVSGLDLHKLAKGIVLPNGYELSDQMPFSDPSRASICFVVEGSDIPHSTPGAELPALVYNTDYSHIVVMRYSDA